jgi:hypothetical protein
VSERDGRDFWAGFQHDPRDPGNAPLRAADVDRDLVQGALTDAFAEGRLDRAEYDERSTAVLGARTLGELPAYVADLLPSSPMVPERTRAAGTDIEARAQQRWAEERRKAVFGFLGTSVFWIIWLVISITNKGLVWPWPAILSALALVNVVRTFGNRDEIIRGERQRLEKRRDRELGGS